MEEEVREHFQMHMVSEQVMSSGSKDRLIAAVKDDEVLFHWCILTAETDDKDAEVVLDMLTNLWITIRGFSFASSWLEMYKLQKKKSLQCSKALRKEIQ